MNFDDYADSYFRLLKDQEKTFKFFAPDRYYFVKYKVDLLADIIKDNPKSILDYGCGIGLALPYFLSNFPNSKISATDISEESLSLVYKNFKDINVISDESLHVNSFDIIYCSGVFHHIPLKDRKHVLEKLFKCLNKNGLLCVFEHNPYNPITRKMVSSCEFDDDAELITKGKMRKLIEVSSFKILKSNYALFFPKLLSKLMLLERYLGWLPLGGQYFIIGEKK
tara:strand:- start:4434 stop:5105 length:672 start_codon:yes stop_codon:yes gene_type:complete